MQLPVGPRTAKTKYPECMQLRSVPPKSEELRSVVDTLEPRREANVTGYPNNQLYIDSGSSIPIFNWELLGGLIQLDQVIKIQVDGKSIIYHKLDHYQRYYTIYCFYTRKHSVIRQTCE